MKQITIRYFAILKDQRGLRDETIDTGAATAAELYDKLASAYNFTLTRDRLRVAVNDVFADWQTPIRANDTIVFIPPVAGG